MTTDCTTQVPLSEIEIEAMADFLANMHDLPIEDLESEFRTIMRESFPTLQREFLDHVYAQFMRLSPGVRFNVKFDHRQFLRATFESYVRNH